MLSIKEETSYRIKVIESDKEVLSTFNIMKTLRENIKKNTYLKNFRNLQKEGFNLVTLSGSKEIIAVSGYRVINNLARGKILYVDDLVTKPGDRSKGYGSILFDWLKKYANDIKCTELALDSGIQRFGAHKFYIERGMSIVGHHFSMKLNGKIKV